MAEYYVIYESERRRFHPATRAQVLNEWGTTAVYIPADTYQEARKQAANFNARRINPKADSYDVSNMELPDADTLVRFCLRCDETFEATGDYHLCEPCRRLVSRMIDVMHATHTK